ncbi:MAG TPA: hypothetical protein VFN61_13420 [Acidimicrobiales bacterium]|nr:hypothetical protein [Acidimicrobiales bacterium]
MSGMGSAGDNVTPGRPFVDYARRLATTAASLGAAGVRAVPGAFRRGVFVGLATSAAYLLQWLTIGATGAPGGIVWGACTVAVQGIVLSLAVYHLCVVPSSAAPNAAASARFAQWRALPEVAFGVIVLVLAQEIVAQSLSSLFAVDPFAWLGYILWLLAFALFFWPWVILWGGCRTWPRTGLTAQPAPGAVQVLRTRARALGWKARWSWALEASVLVGLWQLLRPAISWALRTLFPFPALSSLLQAFAFAAGWAVIAGRLLPRLVDTSKPSPPVAVTAADGSSGGSDYDTPAVGDDRPASRPLLVGGVLALVVVLAFVGLSPNLPQLAVTREIVTSTTVSRLASGDAEGLFAIRQGSAALGDTFALQAIVSAADHRPPASSADVAEAVWWAPQSVTAERVAAWLAATSVTPGGPAQPVLVLGDLGDIAGARQAIAIWYDRHGRSDRSDFFDALQRDPTIELAMPCSSPGAGFTGTSTQTDLARRLLATDQVTLAQVVFDAAQRHAYVEAVADERTIEGLYAGAPAPAGKSAPLSPTERQEEAAGGAMALSGDQGDAVAEITAAFTEAATLTPKDRVAAKDRLAADFLYMTALHGAGSSGTDLVAWAQAHGDSEDHLALGMSDFLQGNRPAALSQFAFANRNGSGKTARSQAWVATAELDYLNGQYPQALAATRRALALGVPATVPAAQAVAGNSILAIGAKGSVAAAEVHLRQSVQAYPYAFMIWYTLGQLEYGQGLYHQAALDDVKAMTSYELDVRAGIGRFAGVVNPSGSIWQVGTDSYGMPHFLSAVQQAISAAQQAVTQGAAK